MFYIFDNKVVSFLRSALNFFYFGSQLKILHFIGTYKTKGDMLEPGTNQRPVYFLFDLRFYISILFGQALRQANPNGIP